MKRPRRILVGIVLAMALAAAAGALIHHLAWRTPAYLAKRLPPIDAMPPGLTAEQRAAIHLLYSPNPSDRLHGVVQMEAADIPEEVQIPYFVALLADDPKLQDENPTSPAETWFWRFLGTNWAKEDVRRLCYHCLECRVADDAASAVIRAMKAEKDAAIRRTLVDILVYPMIRDQQAPLKAIPRATPSMTWCPDPVVLDALVDLFQEDTDASVRAAALASYSIVWDTLRQSMPAAEADTGRCDEGMLPDQSSALGPQHREALLAAARRDPAPGVRREALETIARHMGPEAVAPLVEAAAADPDEGVCEHSAWLLASPGTSSQKSSNLFSRDPGIARPARPAVVHAMIAALRQEALHPRSRSPAVRSALASGLRYLTDQDFGQVAAGWQFWLDRHQGDFAPPP